jgi:DNA-binding transcriptional MerR regulator
MISSDVNQLQVKAAPTRRTVSPGKSAKKSDPGIPVFAKRYTSIHDACRIMGVPAASIRYWERCYPRLRPSQFGLMKQRRYTSEQFLLLVAFMELVTEVGMTAPGAGPIMDRLDWRPLLANKAKSRELVVTRTEIRALLLEGFIATLRASPRAAEKPADLARGFTDPSVSAA